MKRKLLLLLALIPPIVLGVLMWKYSVNIPFWDQWDTPGKLILESSQSKLTWNQWMRQHNESRTFFPNLIFLSLADWTNWNTRYEMIVTFVLACLVSFNIYRLSKITLGDSWQHSICFLLANLLIFNPIQQENWLWGFQGITFTSIAAITTSFIVIITRTPWIIKLGVSSILSAIATFSFANGVLCWIVIFPALIWQAIRDKQKPVWVAFFWLAISSLVLTIYLYDYHRPEGLPSVTQVFTTPILAISYYLSLLGSPIFPHDILSSQIMGGIILLFFGLICLYLWNQRQNIVLINKSFVWLLIGFYVLFSSVLITTGRIGLGIGSSRAPRYITFTTYLIVALIYLLPLVLKNIRSKTIKKIIFSGLTIFLLITYKDNFTLGSNWFMESYYQRVYGKACVINIDLIRDTECVSKYVFPNIDVLEERAKNLNEIDLINPEIGRSIDWQPKPPNPYGEIAKIVLSEDGLPVISGWTLALPSKPSFDAVILTYEIPDGVKQPFAIAELKIDRQDIFKLLAQPKTTKLTWSETIDIPAAPPPGSRVTAWAFDTSDVKAYPLNNIQKMPG